MQEQQSLIALKKQEFRVEIRKKQLNEYFQKRRLEMLEEDRQQNVQNMTDEEQCAYIVQLINNFCYIQLRNIVVSIIEIDPSLSVFYHLTSFNSDSPPIYFSNIIHDTLGDHRDRLINQECNFEKILTFDMKNELYKIWKQMQSVWERESKNYIGIISELKRVENMDFLIRQDIISFLSIILNILLLFKKMSTILSISLERVTLVGKDQLFHYEINQTLTLLSNILAGSDALLVPYINDFLDYNGCSHQCEGLFYNLFLIRNVSSDVKIKMFHYYLSITDHQREYVLENYDPIIRTLYVALQNCPEINERNPNEESIMVGERIIKFISELLKIINLRYENLSIGNGQNDKDYAFLHNLTLILLQLGEIQSLINNIMEPKSIHIYLLNHINYNMPDQTKSLIITSLCLKILKLATNYDYSIHLFINQEPRFLIKIQLLFSRYLQIDYKKANEETIKVVSSLMDLMSQASSILKIAQNFSKNQVLSKIKHIYFHIQGQTSGHRSIKQSCEILYINLLEYLKKYSTSIQSFYDFLFGDNTEYLVLVNMLKYTANRKKIVEAALINLAFITCKCEEVRHFNVIKQMLLSEILSSRLVELTNCDNTEIADRAAFIIDAIDNIKYVEHPAIHAQEDYDYDEMI